MVQASSTPYTKTQRPTSSQATPGGSGGKAYGEKILVTVRVRPLNNKELAQRETIAWECKDEKTLVYKSPPHDRSSSSTYRFDRVFGPTSSTEEVYEEGAKNVALSSLTGINATIFAYGQTSSGKTYTMKGIIENAIRDIYSAIEMQKDRDFIIKFSSLEIYNEIVRDLLNPESGHLRLLDDPEKGTVVEKLLEVKVTSMSHIRDLIATCDAARQVGDTALNERSSRSHQIIKLLVESISESEGTVKSLIASLNFVDLAGSERASQSHAEGTRLKEGCHINRSLLTLSTVIRKLSGGKKFGHVPYRDSKLTRILQLSLGGNARTAIICTMSPAQVHVEQSRNTLTFATNAKEVTNNAQVNMVLSDKEMVEKLKKEVATLQSAMATTATADSQAMIMEKEKTIRKMEMQMTELQTKLDQAQARIAEYRRMEKEHQNCITPLKRRSCVSPLPGSAENSLYVDENADPNRTALILKPQHGGDYEPKPTAKSPRNSLRQSVGQSASATTLRQEIRKLEKMQDAIGQGAGKAMEALHKELAYLRMAQSGYNRDAAEHMEKLHTEIKELREKTLADSLDLENLLPSTGETTNLLEEVSRLEANGNSAQRDPEATIATLEEELEIVQKSFADFSLGAQGYDAATPSASPAVSSKSTTKKKRSSIIPLSLGSSGGRQHLMRSPCSPRAASRRYLSFDNENNPPRNTNAATAVTPQRPKTSKDGYTTDGDGVSSREGTPCHRRNSSVDVKKMQNMFKEAAEHNIESIKSYINDLKERVAKLHYQKQLLVCQVLQLESDHPSAPSNEETEAENEEMRASLFGVGRQQIPVSPGSKKAALEEQLKKIVQLWHVCRSSLVHRTQFFLVFQEALVENQLYMEIEYRRLIWLRQKIEEETNPKDNRVADTCYIPFSIRELKKERDLLAKRMRYKLTEEERLDLYRQWEVPLDTKKRKAQVIEKLWSRPSCMRHCQKSAETVAMVMGICRETLMKEMIELSLAQPTDQKHSFHFFWNPFSRVLDTFAD